MPIDYKKYPKNWKQLRASVLIRAENKCEFCGKINGSVWFSVRHSGGSQALGKPQTEWMTEEEAVEGYGQFRPVKCVLTIAHLDHDEHNHNVTIDRLKALCQACHLQYDAKEKVRRKELKKNQIKLEI